jgi:hypothetical protein
MDTVQSEDPRDAEPPPTPRRSSARSASPSIGWPVWLAGVFGLLGFLLAAAAWMSMGLAALTPLTIDQTLLIIVLLGPVIGGAVALPGVIFALQATRRARVVGAGVAAPLILAGLATAVLVGGLLFGGLVSYPRQLLGTFGLTLQAHCARFEQSLQPYGNPPQISKLQQDPLGLAVTLRSEQVALADDQATLNALTAPDPRYQRLLDDCRSLTLQDQQVTGTLLSELERLPPDVTAAQQTLAQYETATSKTLTEIEQLGAALKQQVFAPFQPD